MISLLRHFFVPHYSNNHRPKLLHHKSLLILILLTIALLPLVFLIRKTAPNVLGVATDVTVDKLLFLTNQKRQEHGLSPLILSSELSQAAAGKATDMFARDYWAHNGPDGTTPWVFVQNSGYNYIYAGENLAKDFGNSEGVVDAWMTSSSHRENILSQRYNEAGFAVVNGRLNGQETTLVVQMLGRRQGTPVAAVPAGSLQTGPIELGVSAPTSIPLATPTPALVSGEVSLIAQASNKPLIDSKSLSRRISILLLALVILAFILDLIYIERKKLIRLVGHNIDHVLFLAASISFILILGRGAIL